MATAPRRLTKTERRHVRAADQAGWLRPYPAAHALSSGMTPMHVRGIGWVVRDNVGVLRDLCGPVHR